MPHQPARHRTRPFIVGSVAVVVAAVVLGTGFALAASQAVSIANLAFSPSTVTVSVGDTVTWTNTDAQTHTATADDASWDAGNIAGGGGTGAVVFPTSGTFPYHCSIHSQMTGTVIVEVAGATAPATGATAVPSTMHPTDTVPIGTSDGGAGTLTVAVLLIAVLAASIGAMVLLQPTTTPLAEVLVITATSDRAVTPAADRLPAATGGGPDERSKAPIVFVGIASAVAVAIVWRRLTSRR
jgi:plastocyanin